MIILRGQGAHHTHSTLKMHRCDIALRPYSICAWSMRVGITLYTEPTASELMLALWHQRSMGMCGTALPAYALKELATQVSPGGGCVCVPSNTCTYTHTLSSHAPSSCPPQPCACLDCKEMLLCCCCSVVYAHVPAGGPAMSAAQMPWAACNNS